MNADFDHRSSNRRSSARRITAFLLVACLASFPAWAEGAAESSANAASVRAFYEEILAPGELDRLPELVAEEALPGLEKRERLVRSLFPDLGYAIERILADGDHVAVFYRLTGKHTGDNAELPASNGRLDVRAVDLIRVEGGKIREISSVSDRLEVALATGYRLVPPE